MVPNQKEDDAIDGDARTFCAEPTSSAPSHVGPYRVLRELGRGGMGVVYEAVHTTLQQHVALKLLRSPISDDPIDRERCLREARACCQVQHPGLVQLFDCKEDDQGHPYLVMEFLDGLSLRKLLKEPEPRSLAFCVQIAMQVAQALAAAHEQGVVHRDVKPENLMVLSGQKPGELRTKLLDFGIAKFMHATDMRTLTSEQATPGTPTYMAPEQCGGDGAVDGRADVYALGVVLFELLCGRPVFVAARQQLPLLHLHQAPRPPRALRPEIPQVLSRLVLRMLAKAPARRPTMSEVAEALGAPEMTVGTVRADSKRVLIGSLCLAALMTVASSVWRTQLVRYFRTLVAATRGRVYIPGGRFLQGSDAVEIDRAYGSARNDGCKDCQRTRFEREGPQRWVTLSPYTIDRHEVNWEQFGAWLNRYAPRLTMKADNRHVSLDGIEIVDPEGSIGWTGLAYKDGRFVVLSGMERKPAVLVTWNGAQRYCEEHGGRLPTEAEWEYAARGPDANRFPWGFNWPSCELSVFSRWPETGKCLQLPMGTDAVGSHPEDRSVFGVMDLGGNAAEWTLDAFRASYPPCKEGICTDPLLSPQSEPAADGPRIVRGGAWFRIATFSRAAGRGYNERNTATIDIGFRCVYSDRDPHKMERTYLK